MSLLWTPDRGESGLIVIARTRPIALVVGGRIVERSEVVSDPPAASGRGPWRESATAGGLIIVSSSRKREPSRIVGHPDLASGASAQRGDTLYVSISEAVFRETRGENVELHFEPTPEDAEALSDLKTRARNRWENDRLPDGWTRPLPPPSPKNPSESLPEDLRAAYEEMMARRQAREGRD